jgi:hypothetical protein
MKRQIVEILEALANYYRTQLTALQFAMYAEDLMCLTPEELIRACKVYRLDPKNKFFPLPAALIAIVRPVETELDLGQDVASRVIAAVGRFGSYRDAEAREWIGQVGWECVKRMGGWLTLCAELNEDNRTTLFAQLRGLAQTVHKKAMNGTLDQPQNFFNPIAREDSDAMKIVDQFTKTIKVLK